ELGRTDADAHLAELVARFLVQLGGVKQRLGRDAADVEAGAAERLVLLDHHHLHAELRRADRAEIAARAGTDDDEVVTGHHVYSLVVVPAECHSASKTRVNALMAREPGSILRVLARARSISARLRGDD